MYSSRWRIGLDIQSSTLRAVALQRRRYGWQLRQWWCYELPADTFDDDNLQNSTRLSALLRRWRVLLPRRFSLRIALPAPLVLQQKFSLPSQPLQHEALEWYVSSQLATLLPVAGEQMVLDYRRSVHEPGELYVTAARQEVLDRWLACLAAAQLVPQVVDITPCALRRVAQVLQTPDSCLLVHRADHHWLWVSPWQQELRFGVLPLTDMSPQPGAEVFPQEKIAAAYYSASGQQALTFGYSSTQELLLLAGATELSPFSVVQQLQPPLPPLASAFSLAMGLALREEDHE